MMYSVSKNSSKIAGVLQGSFQRMCTLYEALSKNTRSRFSEQLAQKRNMGILGPGNSTLLTALESFLVVNKHTVLVTQQVECKEDKSKSKVTNASKKKERPER
jgi:hypothetical protein